MGKGKSDIVVIDVGSANVRVLGARPTPNGDIEIFATGEHASLGVERGIVTKIDDASYGIKAALEHAGLDLKARGFDVYATVGGKHVSSFNHCAEVNLSRKDGLVTEKDVERAIGASRLVSLQPEASLVHAITRGFRVDGYLCRRSPIGMRGSTVGAESHVITANSAGLKNLRKAVQMAGREPDGFISNAIAAGQAVLSQAEKDNGAVVIDIGAGSTDVAAFIEGAPFHTASIPVGGNQIANDLAVALNTAFHVAERLYREEGSGSSAGVSPTDELTVPCFGLTGTRTLRRLFLNDVIRLRLQEILSMAYLTARNAGTELPQGAPAVITGGVANLRAMEALAGDALDVTVRVGKPIQLHGLPPELMDPRFATAVGAMRLAADPNFDMTEARHGGAYSPIRLLPQWRGLRAGAA